MARITTQFSTRSILLALVALNCISIGLSEVQRRALLKRSFENQETVARQVASLTEMHEKLVAAQDWHDSKLDRVAALLAPEINPRADRMLADSRWRDSIRIDHAKILKAALRQYYAAKGVFPGPFADNAVEDLTTQLVGGGYLKAIPSDPQGKSYRYTTQGAPDGKRYGLRVTLENGGDCLTGVGIGPGWWGALPQCPF
jgi:hypothetical protein